MASQRWTEDDIERAKLLRKVEHMGHKEIGNLLGRSQEAVCDMFRRYEARNDHLAKLAGIRAERKEIMTRMVAEGKTSKEIAAATGLKQKHCCAVLQQFGLKAAFNTAKSRSFWTPEKEEQALNLRARGFSGSHIAKTMGVSKGAVFGLFFRHRAKENPNYLEDLKRQATARQERDQEIIKLRHQGKGPLSIAIALGLTVHVVRHVLERLGIRFVRIRRNRPHGGRTTGVTKRTKPHEGTAYVTDPRDLEIDLWQRKSLQELNFFTCRFPVSDPDKPDFFFCGAMPQAGSSYCAHHHARCYQSEYAMAEAA